MIRKSKLTRNSGFTIVELTLAMAFVAVLMLAIATTVIQIGNVYNRGITLKAVEQAGRLLTADIRRTISQTNQFSLKDDCKLQTNISGGSIVSCDDLISNDNDKILGGRMCTGTYTYIWNYGKYINIAITNANASLPTAIPPANIYAGLNTANDLKDPSNVIRLVKVKDSARSYCTGTTLPQVDQSGVGTLELLYGSEQTGTELSLAIHKFSIKRSTYSDKQVLYKFNIAIGTNDSAFLPSGADFCQVSTIIRDAQAKNLCAVNEFEFTALNDIMR